MTEMVCGVSETGSVNFGEDGVCCAALSLTTTPGSWTAFSLSEATKRSSESARAPTPCAAIIATKAFFAVLDPNRGVDAVLRFIVDEDESHSLYSFGGQCMISI